MRSEVPRADLQLVTLHKSLDELSTKEARSKSYSIKKKVPVETSKSCNTS